MEKEKRTLCGYCNKPIHIDDWGGASKDKGFFHRKCFQIQTLNTDFKEIDESTTLSDKSFRKLR